MKESLYNKACRLKCKISNLENIISTLKPDEKRYIFQIYCPLTTQTAQLTQTMIRELRKIAKAELSELQKEFDEI